MWTRHPFLLCPVKDPHGGHEIQAEIIRIFPCDFHEMALAFLLNLLSVKREPWAAIAILPIIWREPAYGRSQ